MIKIIEVNEHRLIKPAPENEIWKIYESFIEQARSFAVLTKMTQNEVQFSKTKAQYLNSFMRILLSDVYSSFAAC